MLQTTRSEPNKILLVEDNPGDVRLLQIAMEDFGFDVDLLVACDGDAANEFIRSYKESCCRIALVILDLNLPKKNGLELLAEWKRTDDFKATPVLVLTSSQDPNDVANSHRLGASTYLCKPDDIEGYRALISVIHEFWLKSVVSPGDIGFQPVKT
ncbi:MAG: response regulator [Pirellula sp.]